MFSDKDLKNIFSKPVNVIIIIGVVGFIVSVGIIISNHHSDEIDNKIIFDITSKKGYDDMLKSYKNSDGGKAFENSIKIIDHTSSCSKLKQMYQVNTAWSARDLLEYKIHLYC